MLQVEVIGFVDPWTKEVWGLRFLCTGCREGEEVFVTAPAIVSSLFFDEN
jgi:hypothetical protein